MSVSNQRGSLCGFHTLTTSQANARWSQSFEAPAEDNDADAHQDGGPQPQHPAPNHEQQHLETGRLGPICKLQTATTFPLRWLSNQGLDCNADFKISGSNVVSESTPLGMRATDNISSSTSSVSFQDPLFQKIAPTPGDV